MMVKVARGDYVDLYPPKYERSIRGLFVAPPGYKFVSVDYTAVEMAVLGWLSQDPVLMDHIRRSLLPEDDPEYYDIHANMAVRAFRLDCEPTKKAMKQAGKGGLRVAAKNVNFGIPYGRSPEAIVRQCWEEGVEITLQEAEALYRMYFEQYRLVEPFLQQCRERVKDPGWIKTPYGRYRRFIPSDDKAVMGELQRQAQNFPIQSTVADLLQAAIFTIRQERAKIGARFRMVLPVHDALNFLVPDDELHLFQEGEDGEPSFIRRCMSLLQPFYPTDLSGNPLGVGPYYFGIDVHIGHSWAE